MDKQTIFNAMWTGLSGQGWKRSIADGSCLYRGPGGLKCAVGHLIPDALYDPGMEDGTPWQDESVVMAVVESSVRVRTALVAAGVPVELHAFLRECQRVHDESPPTPGELRD